MIILEILLEWPKKAYWGIDYIDASPFLTEPGATSNAGFLNELCYVSEIT